MDRRRSEKDAGMGGVPEGVEDQMGESGGSGGCDAWGYKVGPYLDGELDEKEARSVEDHLAQCGACKKYLTQMEKLKGVTDMMNFHDLSDIRWQQYCQGIYSRIERGIGWMLLSLGLIILVAFGGYYLLREFFADPQIPLVLRIGTGALAAGAIVLLISVGRETLFRYRNERYKDIDI